MPSKLPKSKKKGWKDVQSKKQATKKIKLAFFVLAFILGLLILGKTIKLIQTLFSPWQLPYESKRDYIWNSEFNINVLLKGQKVSLLTYIPQKQEIVIIDIPKNTYLDLPLGFGKWQISSVFELGESQKGLGGGNLLKITLANFFGLPIDGFLNFTNSSSSKDSMALVSEFRKNPLIFLTMLSNLKTDLTPFELIKLKMGLSSVRFDKIRQIDLEKLTLLQKDKLADSTQILVADAVRIDSIISDLIDPQIRSEHKAIAIFNSTSHSGLAQKAARLITNMGGEVIITTNGQNKFKSTKVLGEKSKTLERLKQIFEKPCQKGKSNRICDKIDPNMEDLVSSRAQINIFLGEDYID